MTGFLIIGVSIFAFCFGAIFLPNPFIMLFLGAIILAVLEIK